MSTMAELGIAVHSESVDEATNSLNKMADAGGRAESAAVGVGAKWDQAGKKVAESAKTASTAIDDERDSLEALLGKIDPTVAAFTRLDKQQQQLSKFKASGLLPADDFAEYSSKIQQTRESLGRFSDSLGKTGISAKQTAAALRGVPAQFTDIVVSLQGGQAPLTVLLQQGGQLKDMFGGVGNAAQALGGYVLGLVNPFTLAAAAAAAVGLAYYQGSKEADAYRNALISTGNASGTTADALAGLAEKVGGTVGNTGKAADALAQLAASGKIARESFEEIATAAVGSQEATGRAVQDTIAEFVKIADDPVAAAKSLNEQYNFLTASTYQQILALKDQGREQEAVTLLTDTYVSAIKARTAQVTENLGYIEKAWAGIKRETLATVDAALNVGRIESTAKRITELQQKVAAAQSALNADPDDRANQEKLVNSKLELDFLVKQKETEDGIAAAQGLSAERQKASIAAQTSLHSDYLSGLDKEEKKKREIEALELKRVNSLKGEGVNVEQINKEYDVALKAINDRYKAAKVAAPAVDLTGFKGAENALKSLEATYQNSLKVLDASQKAGLINDQEYALQKGALLEKEKSDVQAAYQGEIAALEAVSAKSSTTSAQRIQVDQKIADVRSKMVDALKKLDADQEVLSIQTQERLDKEREAIDAYAQALQDSLKRTQDSLDLQLAGFGLGDRSRQQLQEILKIRQEYEEKFDKLERDHRLKRISDNAYDEQTKLLQQSLDQRLEMQQGYYDKEAALRSNWMNGASRAFANYIDETNDVAGQTEGLFSDALHGVEDAFVNAATTGKLSFKDLADSIIADLARIVAKAYIVTPILAALGIGGDSSSSAGGLGSLVTGGGSGGGIVGMLTNVKNVVSVAGSNFGKAVISGWNSGDGILGGLQTAFTNGADYLGSTITSAFSTGSTTAAQVASNYGASVAAGSSIEGYTGSQFGSYVASQNAASSLSALSATLSYVGAVYAVIQSYQAYGAKGAATTAGFAAAGAAIGSIVPVVGTALGAAIGAVIGSFVSSKAFGSGEKYADLSTSATGRYINGVYTDTGIQQGWQTKAPKFGDQVDSIMSSNLNKFSATLGMLYDTLGNGADVVAYNLLQVRKTSGKYSGSYGAQLDDGSVLEFNNQFKAQDAAAAIADNYDNLMGTFLAKAIVSSKSLPNYFKAQFTEFASDWDTTADEVIKAIEGVFTRFNGVNDALKLINVNNLKLDETGLIASDSILNMIGAMSDLDTTTATAKEKVDALNTAVGTYYQAFFSADEQFADLTESLKNAFAGFGLELPDTRSAYRDMVEDIDVTTAAGQAMFATLVGLAKNADSYYSTIDKQASDARQQMLSSAQSALERAINAQKASINDMLETASASVSDLTNISTSLGNALKSLRGDSDSAVKTLRAQAQATLQAALAQARAGKSLAGFDGLDDALSVITGNTTDLYSSLEDFNRDQGRTANVVAELEKLNGKQLSSAEKTVAALQAQLKSLDAQLEFEQAQLDALNGVDTSVKSVAQAVKEMNAAVVAALAGMGGKGTPTNNGTFIDSIYKDVLGLSGGADQAGKDYWLGELANGHITLDQLAQAIANAGKENHQWVKPGYATGGYISGPGTGTSDSIIARLSNGEYVMTAAAVSTYGTDMLDRMNNLQMPQFASGGAVMNVASPVVVGSQRAKAGNDAGDGAEALRQLNKRLSNIETYLDNASRDLRQMNNAGVQVVGTVSTKEVA